MGLGSPVRRLCRCSSERGAAVVEFAIVGPLLLVLLFGIIDFGLTMNTLQGVRQGTREGARQAVVGSFGSYDTCPTTGLTPSATNEDKLVICLTKDRVNAQNADVRVKIALDATEGYVEGAPLVVCVQYEMVSVTGLFDPFFANRIFKSRVQMHVEELGSGSLTSVEEAAPSGGDWTWCQVQ